MVLKGASCRLRCRLRWLMRCRWCVVVAVSLSEHLQSLPKPKEETDLPYTLAFVEGALHFAS